MRIETVKKRADFLAATAEGKKFIVSSFILLARPTPEKLAARQDVRLGLTVTRKMGNAVQRNRIRRRLREAFRAAAPAHALPGFDYVLIARNNALLCPFPALIGDLQFALPRVHKARPSPPRKDAR